MRRDHPELLLEAHSVVRDQAERRVEAAEKGGGLRAQREVLVLALKVKKERHPDLSPFNPCSIPPPPNLYGSCQPALSLGARATSLHSPVVAQTPLGAEEAPLDKQSGDLGSINSNHY